ncbi:MAG: hypothetical protein AAB372_01420 [Patescibacteria group bacterium]|mgnify:CR=1 FL=1
MFDFLSKKFSKPEFLTVVATLLTILGTSFSVMATSKSESVFLKQQEVIKNIALSAQQQSVLNFDQFDYVVVRCSLVTSEDCRHARQSLKEEVKRVQNLSEETIMQMEAFTGDLEKESKGATRWNFFALAMLTLATILQTYVMRILIST